MTHWLHRANQRQMQCGTNGISARDTWHLGTVVWTTSLASYWN